MMEAFRRSRTWNFKRVIPVKLQEGELREGLQEEEEEEEEEEPALGHGRAMGQPREKCEGKQHFQRNLFASIGRSWPGAGERGGNRGEAIDLLIQTASSPSGAIGGAPDNAG